MRKKSIVLLIMTALLLGLVGTAAAAPTITVDGQQLSFDVPPIIENNRVLVPLRAIFEALGATVSWDQATQTVTATKAGTEIKLTIDQATAYKNGYPVELDAPPKIVNNRTLVPIRFVSEALGAQVTWNGDTQTVTILSAPQPTTNTISIINFAFSPASLTTNTGDTVTWVNQDSVAHRVVGPAFDSGVLSTGQSYRFTFNQSGTFNYNCSIHPSMQGVVIVQQTTTGY